MRRGIAALLAVCLLLALPVQAGAAEGTRVIKAYYNVDKIITATNIGFGTKSTVSTNRAPYYAYSEDSFLLADGEGYAALYDTGGEADLYFERYDSNFARISMKRIPRELPLFGGAHKGSDGRYYLVFGRANPSENPSAEVLRIVQYDASLRKQKSLSVQALTVNTELPFRSGNVSMDESGGVLTVHTSRRRFKSANDGLNHQSNLTLKIATGDMSLLDASAPFPPNHVSHSFAQFVKHDGADTVYADHGDAYPRSVVLQKEMADGSRIRRVDLLGIAGEIGANYTGAMTGGLEISGSRYIVAGNSIPQNGSGDKRNIFVASVPRAFQSGDAPDRLWLSNYAQSGEISAGVPNLVKLSNDRFAVLWESFNGYTCVGLHYQLLDGNMNKIGEAHTLGADIRLPEFQRLLVRGDKIIWYVSNPDRQTYSAQNLHFYVLDTSLAPVEPKLALSHTSLQIEISEAFQLKVALAAEDDIAWSSSNSAVASVEKSGFVHGEKAGTAIITAKNAQSGLSAQCSVRVRAAEDANTKNRGNSIGNHATGGALAFGEDIVYLGAQQGVLRRIETATGRATELYRDTGGGTIDCVNALADRVIFRVGSSGSANRYTIFSLDKKTGKLTALVAYEQLSNVQVVGGYVYYLDGSRNLCRIMLSGRYQQTVVKRRVGDYIATKNALYYGLHQSKGIYRSDRDGKNESKIGNDKATSLNVINGKVYYLTESGTSRAVIQMNLNGKQRAELFKYTALGKDDGINVHEGFIYFAHKNGAGTAISRYSLGSGSRKMVAQGQGEIAGGIALDGNYLYFTAGSNLYRVKGGGGTIQKLF